MRFGFDDEQVIKLNNWIDDNNKIMLESGKSRYTGAIGGRFSYEFTPTNLGIVAKVYDALTKTEIDLTNYDMW